MLREAKKKRSRSCEQAGGNVLPEIPTVREPQLRKWTTLQGCHETLALTSPLSLQGTLQLVWFFPQRVLSWHSHHWLVRKIRLIESDRLKVTLVNFLAKCGPEFGLQMKHWNCNHECKLHRWLLFSLKEMQGPVRTTIAGTWCSLYFLLTDIWSPVLIKLLCWLLPETWISLCSGNKTKLANVLQDRQT